MRKALVLAVVASAALHLGAAASASAGTLDQQQTDNSGFDLFIFTNQSLAQTFTAGLSGGLDQVDLNLRLQAGGNPTAPLSVEIRDASGGAPGNMVLASQSVPGTAVSGSFAFVPVVFSAPAPVLAGTQYAIVAFSSTTTTNAYDWSEGTAPNPYAGGAGFSTANSPPSGAWNPLNRDFAFKTYVALPTKPSNTFSLAAIRRNKKQGTATLTFNLPNPGDLAGTGQGAQVASTGAVTSKAVPAGAATLLVKAKGKKKRKLNETGKVKLNLTVTYTPTGGDPSTQSVKVKLRKKL